MDINTLRIVSTVACLAIFVGILVWAYARRNKAGFERDALIPFTHDEA
jgi:cytochrome c oxidase cbb3-type subunit 4